MKSINETCGDIIIFLLHNTNYPSFANVAPLFRKKSGRSAKKSEGPESREPERNLENENDVFPLTDPSVAATINQISTGLCAAHRAEAPRCVALHRRRSRRQGR